MLTSIATLRPLAFCAALPLAAMLGACSSESDNEDTTPTYQAAEYEQHGCMHLEFGPDGSATAAATSNGTLPDVSANMTRISLELVAIEGGNGGFGQFVTMADGVHAFFIDVDTTLELLDANGVVAQLERTGTTTQCEQVLAGYFFDLDPGTYTISVGPTGATTIQIVPVRPLADMDMGDVDMADMDPGDAGSADDTMDMEDGM